jgi:hypothetical protein
VDKRSVAASVKGVNLMDQKVFDWTNEADRLEYKKLLEHEARDHLANPPQDRRSKIVRDFLARTNQRGITS